MKLLKLREAGFEQSFQSKDWMLHICCFFWGAILDLLLFSACCVVEPTCYRGAIKPKIAVSSLYSDSSGGTLSLGERPPILQASRRDSSRTRWTSHGCGPCWNYCTHTVPWLHRNTEAIRSCKVRRCKYTESLSVTCLLHNPLTNRYHVPLLFVLHTSSFTVTYRLVGTPSVRPVVSSRLCSRSLKSGWSWPEFVLKLVIYVH